MTALAEASAIVSGLFPEEFWDTNDDACDCVFQRIGMWTNPYLGETLEVRMCCIWKELYKLFPEQVRVTKGFMNYNENQWDEGVREWDGEDDMPQSIWYRHLARKTGRSVAEIREEYRHRDDERPRGKPRPVVEPEPDFGMEMLISLAQLIAGMKEQLDGIEDRLDAAGLAGVQRRTETDRNSADPGDPCAVPTGDRAVAP